MDVTRAWLDAAAAAIPDLDPALLPVSMSDADRRAYVAKLAAPLDSVLRRVGARIAGLAGPPGSGKSTLARVVAALRPGTLVASMDDFYLSRREREERGLAWRGGPGSHDLGLLLGALRALEEQRLPLEIPRYSAHADDRGDPEVIEEPPELVLLEGWFLGYGEEGYGEILPSLDVLVFLEVEVPTAKDRRFAREAALRGAGGGFAPDQMQRFWDDVLAPGIERLVPASRAAADLVVATSAGQEVVGVDARSDRVADALLRREGPGQPA